MAIHIYAARPFPKPGYWQVGKEPRLVTRQEPL